ncbi:MAG: pitrilysin family protein [Alistipes sp.]
MITFKTHTLANGLTVIVNRDRTSKLAAVNIVYKVGARNEDPLRTGFAHLFEHLMFRGTREVPDFDTPVQMACGENNAFTNNDYTDFYITLPKDNIETALFLESDRMTGLAITEETLTLEKRVVIEEFRQRYLNQPYGDQMMLLRALAYTVHPYRWATIGLSPEHIEQATLAEVTAFYAAHYHPSNAILSISGDFEEEQMIAYAEQWFAAIPDTLYSTKPLPTEPPQTIARRQVVERDVPATAILIAFPIGGRTTPEFFLGDITSDLLAGGDSSRLYKHLVKEQGLFSSINAYVTGELDPGLFIFSGQLLPTTTEAQAEEAIWREIKAMQTENVPSYELEKVKNKFEANTLFGEINVMNKAMNLGFYELTGELNLINKEVQIYRSIHPEQIVGFCLDTFLPEYSSTLIYRAKS